MAKKKTFKKFLSILACFVLITAIVLTATGCQKTTVPNDSESVGSVETPEQQTLKFTFVVVDGEGNENTLEINTTEQTVGAALIKEGLIEGEDGPFGLYVKAVNGIYADYDTDGTYWAFYVGDTYASTGVDKTDITDGETYTFKVEKG